MANPKQKELAKNIVLNTAQFRHKTRRELLIASGYSPKTAYGAGKQIIENEEVQKELVKLGFTSEAAKARIAEIVLTGEDGDAIRAAQEIFKVNGDYAPEKKISLIGTLEVLKDLEENETAIVREN